MKPKVFISFLIIIALVVGAIMFECAHTNIKTNQATIVYHYSDVNFTVDLTSEESKTIKKILNHKLQIKDNPSCGFNSEIAIQFDSISFSVACDGCGFLRVNNTGKYIHISQKNKRRIVEIFEKYGGNFPCV